MPHQDEHTPSQSTTFLKPADQFQYDDVIPAFRLPAQRLRKAGYSVEPAGAEPELQFVRKYQRNWKGVTWVVLASFDGSLGYRIPTVHYDATDPFKVITVDNLPDTVPIQERDNLSAVRWSCHGTFPDVAAAILGLPELPGHSQFRPV
jgi:hypothetical protein